MAKKGFNITIYGIADLDDANDVRQLSIVVDKYMQNCISNLEDALNIPDPDEALTMETKKGIKIKQCSILGYSDDEYPEVSTDEDEG